MASSGKFTWRITDFSRRQSKKRLRSDVFTVGGCNWQIRVYPKGRRDDVNWLSVYLKVADVGLPSGWCIDSKFNLTLLNQLRSQDSTTFETHGEFTALESSWGWRKFKRLTKLHDSSKGYLVNDAIVVEAEIEVLNVSAGSSFNGGLKSKVPSLEEVKMARQSLKECLSDDFKLNIKDRLATSVETLSRTEIGLSFEEQRVVELFWDGFDDFVADFLTFEQENSEFKLHKLARDQILHCMKDYHETHISNKQRLEVKSEKTKLISDWRTLMMELNKKGSEYTAQEKKLEEAKEKKKIAEERMSDFTAAWSLLKAHFAN